MNVSRNLADLHIAFMGGGIHIALDLAYLHIPMRSADLHVAIALRDVHVAMRGRHLDWRLARSPNLEIRGKPWSHHKAHLHVRRAFAGIDAQSAPIYRHRRL